MNKQGLLLCARYSVAPNYFGYCGPDENKNLIDHLKENIADREIQSVLSEFETLFLNLTLIAYENKITDPFDSRVVEAYWIGNSLLHKVKNVDYTKLLKEKFKLPKKIGNNNFLKMQYKLLSSQVLPHHAFHVFNIFKRTGNDPSFHTIETMDNCRIGWGKISQISNIKYQNDKSKIKNIDVKTTQLILENGKLQFSNNIIKKLNIDYRGKTFLQKVNVGDWVSFHWGFVCDKLTERQIKNLIYYTQKAIDFYNNVAI
jgi:hydrogenase maturation factor